MSDSQIKAILTVEGLRKFQTDMDTAADTFDKTGRSGTQTADKLKKAAKGGFLAAGAAAVMSVKSFASFDDAMNRVRINSGANAKDLDRMEEAARKMGEQFPASATEVADAMNEILKAGMSVEDMLGGGLENALAMATAEGMDMAVAGNAMSQAMAVFAIKGKDANKVTAALSNVASDTSADVNDLTSSLSQVGGTASLAGMSVGDTSAALGVLIQNGLDGSKAGTALNSMLLSLRAPTDQATKALKKAGVEVYDATGKMRPFRDVIGNLQSSLKKMSSDQARASFLQKAFGVDAQQAASILTKQLPLYDRLAAGTKNITAPVDKAREQMRSLAMQLDTTGESIGNMAMRFGAALAPSVAAALPFVQQAADMLGNLDAGTIQTVAAFVALSGALWAVSPAVIATTTALRTMTGAIALQSALSGSTGLLGAFRGALGAATLGVRALTAAALTNPLFMSVAIAGTIIGVVNALKMLPQTGAEMALIRQRDAASVTKTMYDALKTSVDGVIASQLAMQGSSLAVERAEANLAAANKARKAARDEYTKNSPQYKAADLAQREALLQLKVAEEQAKKATEDHAAKKKALVKEAKQQATALSEQNKIYQESKTALQHASDAVVKLKDGSRSTVGELMKTKDGLKAISEDAILARGDVGDYAKAMLRSQEAMDKASASGSKTMREIQKLGSKAANASHDVQRLRAELDLIPSTITTTIKVKRTGSTKAPTPGGFASGGIVRGAGTGTSDSIPAMLSNGEWVLTAKQAKAIGYGNLAAIPNFAKGGAWFAKQSAAARSSMDTGSAYWKRLEKAGTTETLLDDRKIIANQLAQLRKRQAKIKKQKPGGKTKEKKQEAARERSSALNEVGSMIRDLQARIWRLDTIEIPQQRRDKAEDAKRAKLGTLEDQINAVGSKGTDLWKKASLAAATDTLDDDLAVLYETLESLKTFGSAASGRIKDVEADIWTMLNVTMPGKAGGNTGGVGSAEHAEREAQLAMSRGFFTAGGGGGAGGGGNMGTIDTTGGDAGGVGYAPRPDIDQVFLAGARLNNLDVLTSGVGVQITQILGWDEAEDLETSRSKRHDGDALGGHRDGSVRIVVKGRVRGSTYRDYHTRRRELKRLVRRAVEPTLMKVSDITASDNLSYYATTYNADSMIGFERRTVRLTGNVKFGDMHGRFGSDFEFELRSDQRWVQSDTPVAPTKATNNWALLPAAALGSIIGIKLEVPALTLLPIQGSAANWPPAIGYARGGAESTIDVLASNDAQQYLPAINTARRLGSIRFTVPPLIDENGMIRPAASHSSYSERTPRTGNPLQDTVIVDTIKQEATLRTPVNTFSRMVFREGFIAAILQPPTRLSPTSQYGALSFNDSTARMLRVGSITSSPSGVFNENVYVNSFRGLMADTNEVTARGEGVRWNALPYWTAKVAGQNVTPASYLQRPIPAAMPNGRTRPVIYAQPVRRSSLSFDALSSMANNGKDMNRFAHLLTLDIHDPGGSGRDRSVGIGFYRPTSGDPFRMAILELDQKQDGSQPVPARKIAWHSVPVSDVDWGRDYLTAILDAGDTVHAFVYTTTPSGTERWLLASIPIGKAGVTFELTTSLIQSSNSYSSQLLDGTPAPSDAYYDGDSVSIGVGTSMDVHTTVAGAYANNNAINPATWDGSPFPPDANSGGLGGIFMYDALKELSDYNITRTGLNNDAFFMKEADLKDALVGWARSVAKHQGYGGASDERASIAVTTEWGDTVPEAVPEDYIRLDSRYGGDPYSQYTRSLSEGTGSMREVQLGRIDAHIEARKLR